MLTKVVRLGDSVAIVLEPEILELSGLEVGGTVDVQVEPNGVLSITSIQTGPFRKVVTHIFQKKETPPTDPVKQIS